MSTSSRSAIAFFLRSALGTGKNDEKGNKIPFDVKVGDIVLTSRYGGTEVKVDDKEYKVVSQDDILAVVG